MARFCRVCRRPTHSMRSTCLNASAFASEVLACVNTAVAMSIFGTISKPPVVAQLADAVISVERVRALFEKARAQLAPLRLDRVRLVHGDGLRGHPPNA